MTEFVMCVLSFGAGVSATLAFLGFLAIQAARAVHGPGGQRSGSDVFD